jgi:hypothetical protein
MNIFLLFTPESFNDIHRTDIGLTRYSQSLYHSDQILNSVNLDVSLKEKEDSEGDFGRRQSEPK